MTVEIVKLLCVVLAMVLSLAGSALSRGGLTYLGSLCLSTAVVSAIVGVVL
jgi:hypothetical protein